MSQQLLVTKVRWTICVYNTSDKLLVKERLALSVTIFRRTKRLPSRPCYDQWQHLPFTLLLRLTQFIHADQYYSAASWWYSLSLPDLFTDLLKWRRTECISPAVYYWLAKVKHLLTCLRCGWRGIWVKVNMKRCSQTSFKFCHSFISVLWDDLKPIIPVWTSLSWKMLLNCIR